MKKIVMTVVLGLLTAMQSAAQSEVGTVTLMPKIGGCWATMTSSDIYYGENLDGKASAKGKLGLVGGVEAEYQLLSGLGLSMGAVYARQGMAYEDVPGVLKDYKVSLDYLNLPVLAHLYVAPQLALQLGVQPGFLLREDKGNYRTFDFGIPVGLSYDFDRLRLECRYCFGLYDTTKHDLNERNRSLQLTVGYRFTL